MYEFALRGLWPKAITEARNVLAQQGGENDDARLLIAVGHIACRRIDAAREALSSLENDDPPRRSTGWEWDGPTWKGLRVLY